MRVLGQKNYRGGGAKRPPPSLYRVNNQVITFPRPRWQDYLRSELTFFNVVQSEPGTISKKVVFNKNPFKCSFCGQWKDSKIPNVAFIKELSFCHNLKFSNLNIFATKCRRPQIFQTMNSVKSNSLSLKYQVFPPSGCQAIGIRKFKFVAKTQFLY